MTSKNSDLAPSPVTRRRYLPRFRVALLVGISLALIPTLLTRKVLAKRAHEPASTALPKSAAALERQAHERRANEPGASRDKQLLHQNPFRMPRASGAWWHGRDARATLLKRASIV